MRFPNSDEAPGYSILGVREVTDSKVVTGSAYVVKISNSHGALLVIQRMDYVYGDRWIFDDDYHCNLDNDEVKTLLAFLVNRAMP